MAKRSAVAAIAICALLSFLCGKAVAGEDADLQQRITKLEADLKDMKDQVAKSQGQPAPGKQSAWSKIDVQLTGYIKLDAAWDSNRIYPGNYALWVASQQGRGADSEFNMTANQSRICLSLAGPEAAGAKTGGWIEADFYGAGASEANKPDLMLRRAFVKLDWPSGFSLLAGQEWDVVSPLIPETLNFLALAQAGNPGYRRPQIRATQVIGAKEGTRVKLETALTRTISDLTPVAGGIDAGRDSGFPTVQGRVSVSVPRPATGKDFTVGLSAHYGQEEYDLATTGVRRKYYDSESVNLDVTIPVNTWLGVQGEVFTGENLSTYVAGIGQGVLNAGTADGRSVETKGGWFAATIKPAGQWRFNVGSGCEDVDNDDIAAGGRGLNRSVFGNAIWSLSSNLDVGCELSHWFTDYKQQTDADAVRMQTSLIYKF